MSKTLMILTLALGLGLSLGQGAGTAGAQADDKHPVVVIDTSMGEIAVELDAEKAPLSTENFLKYVDDKYYDGLIFHRVIPNFMIQGGGFDQKLTPKRQGLRAPILNEGGNGLKNTKGTIAMARTRDPNSATSQFYINHKDNDFLNRAPGNPGYAVFGKVIDGMDVLDKIANTRTVRSQATDGQPLEALPVEAVVIKSIRRKNKS
jgi:cyclophilin family peptidyl-prolyl cis-trans isomerase